MSKKNKAIVNKLESEQTNDIINKDIIYYVLYLLICLLPQFFRGGYFENSYLLFIFFVNIAMLFHINNNYRNNENTIVQGMSSMFLLFLTVIYGLSFFYGINKRGSILEFIKYMGFLSVFLISRDLHRNEKKRDITVNIIIIAGVILSIFGVGTMIGSWSYGGSYVWSRLSSTFQYPNTLAVYASFMYILTMGKALIEEKPFKIGIYGVALIVFFSTLIFTYSRAMWLIFPIVLLLYFIVLSPEKKVQLFFYTLINLLIALPFSFLFLRYIDGSASLIWTIYISGIILSGIALFALGKASGILKKVSSKMILIIVLGITVLSSVIFGVFLNATVPISYENSADKDISHRLSRNVKNVFPNTEYSINVKGNAVNETEDGYAGRIVIYSTDEKREYTHLNTTDIIESGNFDIDIDILSLEDTNSLLVYFENWQKNTKITFEQANIKDLNGGKEKKIPLKYKYIPENIVTRISGINSSDSSLQGRVIFSKDALKLAMKSPILGSGGSSWITAYRSVQSYPYWSKQVHNHFLQVLVEVGALGLLLFLGILISLLYKYIGLKRSDIEDKEKTMADSLIVASFAILAHAFIDFDFSLTGYYIVFWILLGMISSMVSKDSGETNIFSLKFDKSFLKKTRILIAVLSVIAIIISGMLYGGIQYHEKALDAEYEDDLDLAEKYMKKASSLDPYNTEYRERLVGVYLKQYSNKSDNSYGPMAKEEVDKTLKIGKKDPLVYVKATESYFKFGLIEEGIGLINRSLELQPLVIQTYLQNTNIYTSTFKHYISQNEFSKGEELARLGYEKVYTSLMAANEKSIKPMTKDNQVFFELGELKYYSENMDEFLSYLEKGIRLKYAYDFDLDVDNDGKVELMSIWNSNGGELSYEIEAEDGIRVTNPGKEYGVLDSVWLNLEANRTYTVSLDAKGNMDMDKVTFYILDTKATDQIQSDSIKLDLNGEYNTYEYEFTTDEDIGEKTSKFRFVISGENEGYMDLKGIRIFEKMD